MCHILNISSSNWLHFWFKVSKLPQLMVHVRYFCDFLLAVLLNMAVQSRYLSGPFSKRRAEGCSTMGLTSDYGRLRSQVSMIPGVFMVCIYIYRCILCIAMTSEEFVCCFCLWLELTVWPSLIELNELLWSWNTHYGSSVGFEKEHNLLFRCAIENTVMSNDFSMMVDIAPSTISITRRVRRLFTVDFPPWGSGTLQVLLKFSGAEGWERSHQRSKGARELRVDGWKRYSREV